MHTTILVLMIGLGEARHPGGDAGQLIKIAALFVIPFALAFLTYRDFLGLWFWTDDFVWLQAAANPSLGESIKEAVALPQGATPYWRPLIDFHFFSMYRVFGLSGAPYHVFNVVLHAATAAMLGLLVVRLTRSWAMAGLGAALFAVSPTYVTMVTWASGATAIYAAFFGVVTVLLYVDWLERSRSYRWLVLPVLTFAAALAAKEETVVLPAILAVVAVALHQERRDGLQAAGGSLVPFIGIWLAFMIPQLLFVVGGDESPGYSIGMHAVRRLIDSMAWLSLPYPLRLAEWISPARWAAFSTFTLVAVISALRRQWLLPGAYAATVLLLLPSSFFTGRFSPHWTYMASVPWALFVGACFAYAFDLLAKVHRSLGVAVAVVVSTLVIVVLAGRTIDTHVWVPPLAKEYQEIERTLAAGCPAAALRNTIYVVELPIVGPGYAIPALVRLRYSPAILFQLTRDDLSEASLPETGGCSLYWTEREGYQAVPGPPPEALRLQ